MIDYQPFFEPGRRYVCPSVLMHLCVYPSAPVHPLVLPSFCPSARSPARPCVHASVRASVRRPPVRLSVGLSVLLRAHPSVRACFRASMLPFLHPSCVPLYVRARDCACICAYVARARTCLRASVHQTPASARSYSPIESPAENALVFPCPSCSCRSS